MTYHSVKSLDVVVTEVHMSVLDAISKVLQTNIAITIISTQNHHETANKLKNTIDSFYM